VQPDITSCVQLQDSAYECNPTSQTRSSLQTRFKFACTDFFGPMHSLANLWEFQRLFGTHSLGTCYFHRLGLGSCAHGTWTAILGLDSGSNLHRWADVFSTHMSGMGVRDQQWLCVTPHSSHLARIRYISHLIYQNTHLEEWVQDESRHRTMARIDRYLQYGLPHISIKTAGQQANVTSHAPSVHSSLQD
jgi:hypothetical protein